MIESIRETREFKELPLLARTLFLSFVDLANTSLLHPLDMRRFYRFIRFCHARKVNLGEHELRAHLLQAKFSEEDADNLSSIYYHGRNLLSVGVPHSRSALRDFESK